MWQDEPLLPVGRQGSIAVVSIRLIFYVLYEILMLFYFHSNYEWTMQLKFDDHKNDLPNGIFMVIPCFNFHKEALAYSSKEFHHFPVRFQSTYLIRQPVF